MKEAESDQLTYRTVGAKPPLLGAEDGERPKQVAAHHISLHIAAPLRTLF